MIPMNILLHSMPTSTTIQIQSSSFSSTNPFITFKISCSSQKPPQNNNNGENNNNNNNNNGDRFSTDWNKAWSSFKKQATGTKNRSRRSSKFDPNKYVTWNPRQSNYPLSEEVDPIKRTEKSNLMIWTSPRFTLFGAIVLVSFLLIYTLLAPIK